MKFSEYVFYTFDGYGAQLGVNPDFIGSTPTNVQRANLSFASSEASTVEIFNLLERYSGIGFGQSTISSIQEKFHSVLLLYP